LENIYLNELQYQRKYDQALPPFDRLNQKKILNDHLLNSFDALRAQTNPITLRAQIEFLITTLLPSLY
jgi:hypothetical protein